MSSAHYQAVLVLLVNRREECLISIYFMKRTRYCKWNWRNVCACFRNIETEEQHIYRLIKIYATVRCTWNIHFYLITKVKSRASTSINKNNALRCQCMAGTSLIWELFLYRFKLNVNGSGTGWEIAHLIFVTWNFNPLSTIVSSFFSEHR